MTLRSLILSAGSTPGDAGRVCGVDPRLFDRIDAGRQPLPLRAARSLAALLGVTPAEVLSEAHTWVDSNHPMFFRPVPGIPGIDFENSPPYRAPVEIPRVRPDYPLIFPLRTYGEIPVTTFRRIGRHDGVTSLTASTDAMFRPRRVVQKDGLCWTVGTSSLSRCLCAFDPLTPSVAFIGSFDLLDPRGLVHEEVAGRLWTCQSDGAAVSRLDEDTGIPDLNVDVSPAFPADLLAEGGLVYAALNTGEVVRIDPVAGVVMATLSGVANGARALGSAGDGTIYVVGRLGELRAIDADSFEMSDPLVLTGAAINEPESLYVDATHIYVSDRTNPASDARLVRVDRQTLVSTARTYPVAAAGFPAGALAFDGLYLWMPDEGGPLRKILPSTLETLLEVPDSTGCSAVFVLRG